MELCGYLESQGISGSRLTAMNIGGTVKLAEGLSVTMVHAVGVARGVECSCTRPAFRRRAERRCTEARLLAS